MAEEKILKDEILKDEELEKVAGGSTKEIMELYKAAKSNPAFVELTHMNTGLKDIGDIEMEMVQTLDNFGVSSNLFQGKQNFVNKNMYFQGGSTDPADQISHAELLRMIKNYKK